MTSLHRYLSVIVLALVIAALATPIAQAGSARPDLAGKTEAKGYAALSQAILNTSRRGSTSPSEAKGYAALSQAILNTSRLQSQSQAVSSGFDWGDAGIGAAATLGLVLLTMAGLVTLARGRRRQPTHA